MRRSTCMKVIQTMLRGISGGFSIDILYWFLVIDWQIQIKKIMGKLFLHFSICVSICKGIPYRGVRFFFLFEYDPDVFWMTKKRTLVIWASFVFYFTSAVRTECIRSACGQAFLLRRGYHSPTTCRWHRMPRADSCNHNSNHYRVCGCTQHHHSDHRPNRIYYSCSDNDNIWYLQYLWLSPILLCLCGHRSPDRCQGCRWLSSVFLSNRYHTKSYEWMCLFQAGILYTGSSFLNHILYKSECPVQA